jgi:hypothetical protein
MAGTNRHQALIEAPIEDVCAVVSDPRTHPEGWILDVIDALPKEVIARRLSVRE